MSSEAKAGLACAAVVIVLLICGAFEELRKFEHRFRVLAYSVWGLNFEETYEAEFNKQLEEELNKRQP